jgi:transposase
MIGLPGSVRVFVALHPVDMRNGPDGLSAEVRRLKGDPFSGHLYVFASRRRDRIKILTWHRGGFVVWYKRLERGQFPVPRQAEGGTTTLDAAQLALLLDGIDYRLVRTPPRWEPPRAV